MRKYLVLLALLVPVCAMAGERKLTARVDTAFGSVATSYAEKLAENSYTLIDILNQTDCDVEVRLDDVTGTPAILVPAGTSYDINAGEDGRDFYQTSVSLQKLSGETCSSGTVSLQGRY